MSEKKKITMMTERSKVRIHGEGRVWTSVAFTNLSWRMKDGELSGQGSKVAVTSTDDYVIVDKCRVGSNDG